MGGLLAAVGSDRFGRAAHALLALLPEEIPECPDADAHPSVSTCCCGGSEKGRR